MFNYFNEFQANTCCIVHCILFQDPLVTFFLTSQPHNECRPYCCLRTRRTWTETMLMMIHLDFALARCLYYKICVNTVVLIGAASVQGKPCVE